MDLHRGFGNVQLARHFLVAGTLGDQGQDLALTRRQAVDGVGIHRWRRGGGGARGYLLKTMDSEMLASAIQRTMAGESVVSPEMTSKLVNAFQTGQGTATPPPPAVDTDPIHSLSPREREILALIAKGASNKELARDLNIAEATVKIHVQHILRKLNLSSRVQAAVYLAGRQG